VTDLLRADYACVRVDLRGHGASSTASDYSMQSLVADVRAVVEELADEEAVLVGHSLGASVVAMYAAAHAAGGVICVDQSLRFGDFAEVVQRYADALRGERTMDAVLSIDRHLQLEPYHGVEAMERRILAFPREVVLGIWAALLTTPPDQLTAIAETILPRISAPLVSLHGSPPPSDYDEWLTALVGRAQVEVWEGSGHMLHLVDPERFSERVRVLLADAESSNEA
jgi:pimeloyl-ACP methyl ester carboxylesterase